VAWKGVPAHSKNKACPVGFSDLLAGSVCPPSSGRRGDGKRGWRANVACGEFVKLQRERDAADSWRSTSVAQVWLPTQHGAGRQSRVYYMVAKLATMISGIRGGHSKLLHERSFNLLSGGSSL
jgi:hypothetical protein